VECIKVLIVDQEEEVYKTLKQGLVKHGYDIHISTAIPNALALAGAHRYQIAFISLPLMYDTALLTGLQAELPDLPIILILPSERMSHIPPQALAVAANSMGKPLELELVRLMLDRTLELAVLRAQVRQHRQVWYDFSALHSSAEALPVEGVSGTSFEAALASKLRHLVVNLEVLGKGSLHRLVLSHVEKLLLTVVLSECRGHQVRSAELLGINRNTLRKKIHEFGISFPRGGA
jgi:DNA-binding NtrC family response regulator